MGTGRLERVLWQRPCRSRGSLPLFHERGNFSFAYRADKKKPNESKVLHFDTLKCGNSAGYVMVLCSARHFGGGLHDFRTLPWPLRRERIPEHWPNCVGRFWLQVHRSYTDENWDAAAVMARSAVQAAMREKDACGPNLRAEIKDLADRGILPPHMKEWAHELRELGNESLIQAPTAISRPEVTYAIWSSSWTSCFYTCTPFRTRSPSIANGVLGSRPRAV